jgi:hypothetical protein
MKTPKHTERTLQLLVQLAEWGFPPEVQQRLGAFTVVWGIFESNLETRCGHYVAIRLPAVALGRTRRS